MCEHSVEINADSVIAGFLWYGGDVQLAVIAVPHLCPFGRCGRYADQLAAFVANNKKGLNIIFRGVVFPLHANQEGCLFAGSEGSGIVRR